MKVALAQINPTIGDFSGNAAKIVSCAQQAHRLGASLVVFPELAVCGYPPKDLLEKNGFVDSNLSCLQWIAGQLTMIDAIVGFVDYNRTRLGKPIFNAAALLSEGKIAEVRYKSLLPTYDVFDESRHFEPASTCSVVHWKGLRLGVSICEDIWTSQEGLKRLSHRIDPIEALAADGAEVIINISASPFSLGKNAVRLELLANQARKHDLPVLYANCVGGNDDLIFEGNSCVINRKGEVVARTRNFEEDVLVVDLDDVASMKPLAESPEDETEALYRALVLGLSDYLAKCGFGSAVIGLSGGIDSAVTACIAVDALTPAHVTGLAMPSIYTS